MGWSCPRAAWAPAWEALGRQVGKYGGHAVGVLWPSREATSFLCGRSPLQLATSPWPPGPMGSGVCPSRSHWGRTWRGEPWVCVTYIGWGRASLRKDDRAQPWVSLLTAGSVSDHLVEFALGPPRSWPVFPLSGPPCLSVCGAVLGRGRAGAGEPEGRSRTTVWSRGLTSFQQSHSFAPVALSMLSFPSAREPAGE